MSKRAAVVTVSDGVSRGTRDDKSGDVAQELLERGGLDVTKRVVVPDERARIESALVELRDEGIDLIVTTGGTGLGPRDVTPEATAAIIDRPSPGLAELIRATGLAKTPTAALGRGTAGAAGASLILNLPGSPKGVTESMGAVLPILGHALELLAGHTRHGDDRGPGPNRHHEHSPASGRAATRPPETSSVEQVVATAVRTSGSPPCKVGQKLIVGPGGPIEGTLGCAEFDARAVADSPGVLRKNEPELRTYHHELGDVDVFLEPHARVPVLAVLGATPIASYLLRFASALEFRTVLVESRPSRVTVEQSALADSVIGSLDGVDLDVNLLAVHTDHEAPDVVDSLERLLGSEAGFVGIIGSRRHMGPRIEELRARGIPDQDTARLRMPVGLDLGGRSPGEIALSIAAGLVAARNGRQGGWLDRR
jgi:molybdopterin adenylyltransferase